MRESGYGDKRVIRLRDLGEKARFLLQSLGNLNLRFGSL